MRVLGYTVLFLGASLDRRCGYVGVFSAPSKFYSSARFVAVSPVPFVSLRFAVGKTFPWRPEADLDEFMATGGHNDPLDTRWYGDGG